MEIIFTLRAETQIEERGFLKQEVIDSIKHPDHIIKKHGKYYYQNRMNVGLLKLSVRERKNI